MGKSIFVFIWRNDLVDLTYNSPCRADGALWKSLENISGGIRSDTSGLMLNTREATSIPSGTTFLSLLGLQLPLCWKRWSITQSKRDTNVHWEVSVFPMCFLKRALLSKGSEPTTWTPRLQWLCFQRVITEGRWNDLLMLLSTTG